MEKCWTTGFYPTIRKTDGKEKKSKDDTEEDDNVIDVLSFIPPEMLQSNTKDGESNSNNMNTTDVNLDEGLTSELNLDDRVST